MVPLPPLQLTGGAGGSAGPSTASSMFGAYNGVFDASGWTVSTSGSHASALGTSSGAGAAAVSAFTGGAIPWPILIAAAGALAFVLWKKR